MTNIYVVKDTNSDITVSIHKTMTGARAALLEYLKKNTGYTPEEWKEFADNQGYDNVEEFQDAILSMPDYDEDMMMEVESWPLDD